jgi:hypothetical protein
MLGLFLIFLAAQSPAGYRANNNDNEEHHQPPESYAAYLTSEAFVEATFENWESEFLQMGAYVLLTAWLLQKAPRSPRSRTATRSTGPPRAARRPRAPGPVRRGGLETEVGCGAGSAPGQCSLAGRRGF